MLDAAGDDTDDWVEKVRAGSAFIVVVELFAVMTGIGPLVEMVDAWGGEVKDRVGTGWL